MTKTYQQIKRLQRLSEQLNSMAGFFQDIGLETQEALLDAAGNKVEPENVRHCAHMCPRCFKTDPKP